jgi:hypothetical protein
VTEGYQPPTSRSSANPDQDTTTLPRLSSAAPQNQAPTSKPAASPPAPVVAPPRNQSSPAAASKPAGNPWSPSGGRADSTAPPEDVAATGLSARLAAAASTASATATGAANSAKGAIRSAADEAENKAARPTRGRAGRSPRRARLTLSHINVYSVFKFSCVLAIALFFVWLIMVGVLYGILDVSGVFSKINDTVHTISGDGKTNDVVTGSLVFGGAIIIGVVNIVLFIALSTIGAMIYNLCADLVGGAEVTLSERE